MATDPLAPTRPAAAALRRTTPTARRLTRGLLPLPAHPPGVLRGRWRAPSGDDGCGWGRRGIDGGGAGGQERGAGDRAARSTSFGAGWSWPPGHWAVGADGASAPALRPLTGHDHCGGQHPHPQAGGGGHVRERPRPVDELTSWVRLPGGDRRARSRGPAAACSTATSNSNVAAPSSARAGGRTTCRRDGLRVAYPAGPPAPARRGQRRR